MHDLNNAYVESIACLTQRGQIFFDLYAEIFYQSFLKPKLLCLHNNVWNAFLYRRIVVEKKIKFRNRNQICPFVPYLQHSLDIASN